MPDCSGEPVVTTSCAFSFLHARLRVQRAPGIPCALSIRAVDAKLGRIAPRGRGGVAGSTAVIASAAKRSSFASPHDGLLRCARNDGVDGPQRHQCARLVMLILPDKGAAHERD